MQQALSGARLPPAKAHLHAKSSGSHPQRVLPQPVCTWFPRQGASTKSLMASVDLMSAPVVELKAVCVFCGASNGTEPQFMASARRMGEALVANKLNLVYGGGTVGLMGEIARTVVGGAGDHAVTGVIPKELAPREISGQLVGQVHIVDNMHTRKALMARLADGFIAMPGGFGTMEELLEVMTWQQLGFHRKPIGLLNVQGFFDPLLGFFQHAVDKGFVKAHHNSVCVSDDPERLLAMMREFRAPQSLIESLANSKAAVGMDISTSSTDAGPI